LATARGPARVLHVGAEEVGREFVLAIDQVLAIFSLEQKPDHDVAEHARIEIGDHLAQLLLADSREQLGTAFHTHARVTSTG
jgi:uncharacterized membrane protein